MLKIVQHQQGLFLVQEAEDLFLWVHLLEELKINGLRYRRDDLFCCIQWCERHEGRAALEIAQLRSCKLQCQPGFARAARAKQCDKTVAGIGKQCRQIFHLRFTADERGGLARKVVPRHIQRTWRRRGKAHCGARWARAVIRPGFQAL